MKMNLGTLEKVSSILFDELRSSGLQEIEVEDVFYRGAMVGTPLHGR